MDKQNKAEPGLWDKLVKAFSGPSKAQAFEQLESNPSPQADVDKTKSFQDAFRKRNGL